MCMPQLMANLQEPVFEDDGDQCKADDEDSDDNRPIFSISQMASFSRCRHGAPILDEEYKACCGKLSTLVYTNNYNVALTKLHPKFKAMVYTAMDRMEASLYLIMHSLTVLDVKRGPC